MTKKLSLRPGGSATEAGLKLSIAPDSLSASISLTKRFARRWTAERILRFLHRHGVLHGVKAGAVRAIFRDSRFDEPVLVARGTAVVKSEAARVKPFFQYLEIYRALRECPDSKSFAQEAIRRFSIKPGAPIAQQIPGTEGTDGMDVLGNVLSARDPEEELLTPGVGTILSAYTLELLAERDGIVSYDGAAFRVLDAEVHEGDVWPSEANEPVMGTLVVVGDVRSGASIRAKGDVIVCGSVEEAEIHADGSVIIGGMSQGGKPGKRVSIVAGGHVLTGSVRHASASAGHTIWIFGSAMRFTFRADRCIHLCGGNGRALGGTLQAELKICAEQIGSPNEIGTALVVGQRMCELARRIARMKIDLDARDDQLGKVKSLAGVLEELKAREGSLPPDKEHVLAAALRTEEDLRGQAETVRRQMTNLQEQLWDLQSREHTIRCTGTIWPGTRIRMGRASRPIDEAISHTEFVLTPSGIESRPIQQEPTSASPLPGVHEAAIR